MQHSPSVMRLASVCHKEDCRDMGWQPGDIVVSELWPSLRREILKVRKGSYVYRLPGVGDRTPAGYTNGFVSEDWFGWHIEETV
jgi:hypothetical protein